MAKIKSVRNIDVDSIIVGDAQIRTRHVDKEVEELADSIARHGMLEPIVVCPADIPGKFEVLMGQRRLLAHIQLGKREIFAAIIDQPVDLATARTLSLTENLVRRDLDSRDVIDACTVLYKRYGSARTVAEETGLPYNQVLRHVKYDRLEAPLQKVVDKGSVSIDIALKVQDAMSTDGAIDAEEATSLATGLSELTAAQRRQVLRAKRQQPEKPVELLLKEAAAEQRVKQIIVTLNSDQHARLRRYAKQRSVTQDDAAKELISQALESREIGA